MDPTKKTFSIQVYRTDPGNSSNFRYDLFTVPFDKGQSILNVLKYIYEECDTSLAFYDSCRIGKCTGCHVKVNGKTRLACTTEATGEDLILEPISGFPIVRDLVVDRTQAAAIKRKEEDRIQEDDQAA